MRVECPQGQSTRYRAALGRRLGGLARRFDAPERAARRSGVPRARLARAPAPPRAATGMVVEPHSQDHARGAQRGSSARAPTHCRASAMPPSLGKAPNVANGAICRRQCPPSRVGRMCGSTHRQGKPLHEAWPMRSLRPHQRAALATRSGNRRRRVRLERGDSSTVSSP